MSEEAEQARRPRPDGPAPAGTGDGSSSPHGEAATLLHRAFELTNSGSHAEAIEAYDEFLGRFEKDPELTSSVAHAWANKAWNLNRLGDRREAVGIYRHLAEVHATSDSPELRWRAADALFWVARYVDAYGTGVQDELIARFGEDLDARVAEVVARAMYEKASRLSEAGDDAACLQTLAKLVDRFGEASDEALATVVRGLLLQGSRLSAAGRLEEAMSCYEEAVARAGDDSGAQIAGLRRRALINRASMLLSFGRADEAIVVADSVLEGHDQASDPGETQDIAEWWQVKAAAEAMQEDWEAALESYDRLLKRFGHSGDPWVRELVGMARVNRAVALAQLGRVDDAEESFDGLEAFAEDAISAFEGVIVRTENRTELPDRQQNASARLNRVGLLAALGRRVEAVASLEALCDRFADDEDPRIQELVRAAQDKRGELLSEDETEE